MRLVAVLITLVFFILPGKAMADDAALTGALIGAGVGAALGYSIDPTGGAGKGAAIGAAAGYILGDIAEDTAEDEYNMDARHPNNYKYAPPPKRKGSAYIAPNFRNNCRQGQEFYDRAFRVRELENKVYLLEKAAWLCPIDARVHNDLGVAYYFRGDRLDRKRAEDQFKLAIDLRPGYRAPKENLLKLR